MSLPNGNAPSPSNAPTTHNNPAAKFLPLAFVLAGVEGVISAFLIGQTRSAEGSVLFGLSAFRLAMMAGILLASLIFLALAWQWRRNSQFAARIEKAGMRHASLLTFIFLWASVGLLLLALESYFMVFFG